MFPENKQGTKVLRLGYVSNTYMCRAKQATFGMFMTAKEGLVVADLDGGSYRSHVPLKSFLVMFSCRLFYDF